MRNLVAATAAAGEPFSFAATKIRIGHGRSLRRRPLQAGYSPLRQRRIESDTYRYCGRDRCHSGGFLLRIMPPSWHPVPACSPRLCCRRAILHRHDDCAASIPKFGPEIKNRCTQEDGIGEKLASIPKFGPEIKNRCNLWAILEGFLSQIRKSRPEFKNR